jgi:hypothetical protein
LVEAVVERALDSLQAQLLSAMGAAPDRPEVVTEMLDALFDELVVHGHARTVLWLALSGYSRDDDLRVRSFAQAVHAVRLSRHAGAKQLPAFEDTYFTVLLPALALVSLSVMGPRSESRGLGAPLGPRRFLRWLGRMIHDHLEAP